MKSKSNIQNEVLELLKNYNRAGVALSMGAGKTLLGLKHMVINQLGHNKFLIVASKLSILKGWKEEALKHNLEYLLEDIEFVTYRSLCKLDLSKYDIIYLDEAHNLLYNHQQCLNKYQGKILGLTGTPPINPNSEKGFMVDKYCPIVYSYLTDEAVDDKILNDYRITVHYIDLNTEKTLEAKGKNGTWFTSELASYNYWTKRCDEAITLKSKQIMRIMRMKALQSFKSKELYTLKLLSGITNKCLVFANTKEQADRLSGWSYHSSNKDSDKNLDLFKNDVIGVLSCVEQLNEGVNIPNLKEGIILHAYANERKFSQKFGRLLRLNPNDCCKAHILCYRNTIDEQWVKQALEGFDQTKITYI